MRLLLALALVVFGVTGKSAPDGKCVADAGVYHFMFGDWEVAIIQDGELVNFFNFFSVVAIIMERVFEYYFPGREARASMNAVLLRRGADVLLVDTGTGAFPVEPGAPPTGLLLSRLRTLGISAENVTGILLTHAHYDHAGGLLNKAGNAAFPNAEVYISADEDRFWQLPLSNITSQAPHLPLDFVQNFTLDLYDKILTAYSGRIKKLNDLDEPFPNVQAWQFPGHTPGHMVYKISSGNRIFAIVGDILHQRIITVQNPEWNIFSDTNLSQAVYSRLDLSEKLADKKILAMLYHETLPGLGYVVRDRAMFDFSPVARIGSV